MVEALAVDERFEDDTNDELKPGHKLMQGQYTIDSFLNAGGFGITYTARNSLGRKVVIKECFPGAFCRRSSSSVVARSRSHAKEFASIVRSFVDEAHSLAKVKHPNVVGVHQVFEENKTAYMAIDFVEGRDLLDIIQDKDGLPEPAQIETLFKKLLDAIGHIHKQDMLHRDISPDNILLNADMEPILIDFGAARQDVGEENRILSELRVVKDGYSPQEFYVAGAEQGPYSDLYALAATFYHVITDGLPVNSQNRIGAVAAGDADPYVPVAGQIKGYSDKFLRGIDKALATLPKDRFASAESWLAFLEGDQLPVAKNNTTNAIKVVSKPELASVSKAKARILAAIGLIVPITGGVYVMQQDGDDAVVIEAAIAATNENTAAPLEVAQAAATAEVAPLVTETSEPAADLSALLNLASAATAQAEAAARAAEAAKAAEATQSASPEAAEAVAAADVATVGDLGLPVTDVTDPAPVTTAVEDTQPPLALETTFAPPQSAPPLIIESFDLPNFVSAWTLDLTGVQADAAYEIEGTTFASLEEVETTLHQLTEAPSGGTLELSVLDNNTEDADVIETVAMPVVQRTSFPDGTTFETKLIENFWTTTVVAAPDSSELQAADILLGDLDRAILFDKRTSLPETLVEATDQNRERLTLAIRRNEDLTAISFVVPRE